MRNISRVWMSLLLLFVSTKMALITTAKDDNLAGPLLDTSQHLPTNLKWSTDSQTLVFTDIFDPQNIKQYIYEVTTDTLSESNLQPVLPPAQACAGYRDTHYDRLSPNGRFLAYTEASAVQNAEFTQYDIGIANCQEDHTFLLSGQRMPQPTRVLWSENSSAFLAVGWTHPDFPIQVVYVSHYATEITNAQSFDIGAVFQADGDIYGVFEAYDVSADGNKALLRLEVDPREPHQLYLYNAPNPTNSRLLNEIGLTAIVAASFAPGDETKLWLFTPMRVIQYDLITKETTLVDDTLSNETLSSSHRNHWALFSPDGRHLAIFTERGLFVLDLTEQAAQVAQNASQSTTTPQQEGLLRVRLALECPSQSDEMAVGRIFNPNTGAVMVRWGQGIYNELLPQGELEVPGGSEEEPGEGVFEFPARAGGNVTPIFVDDVFHDQRECFVPRAG